jgi:maltooligosyltrehalose trehalohydrolase
LRLDAVHAIWDRSACTFLEELADAVHQRAEQLGREVFLVAESDLNDSRLIRPRRQGGVGLDAQWADDFHHCIHTLLTGEHSGYYADFGELEQLARVYRDGWNYSGQYSSVRQRRFGNSADGLEGCNFVICTQNHDQVGNRMLGERLSQIAGEDKARLAAGAMMLSPFLPLLFMGEECGEPAPFQYHVHHSDPDLVTSVRNGRREEFAEFSANGYPPDPQDEQTFFRSKLHPELLLQNRHAVMHHFYEELIKLRKSHPALRQTSKQQNIVECFEAERVILLRRLHPEGQALVVLHFEEREVMLKMYLPRGLWHKVIDSADTAWGGLGSCAAKEIQSNGQEMSVCLVPYACIVLLAEMRPSVTPNCI